MTPPVCFEGRKRGHCVTCCSTPRAVLPCTEHVLGAVLVLVPAGACCYPCLTGDAQVQKLLLDFCGTHTVACCVTASYVQRQEVDGRTHF